MIENLLSALALVFVIEGILPFVCPHCWRRTIAHITHQPDRSLRIIGLVSMVIGVSLLYIVHHQLLGTI